MSATMSITPGTKLIRLNSSGINDPDDPSLPFRLEASFRPPRFMNATFIMLFGGTEELVIRGETREALERFIEINELGRHPRLHEVKITGPEDEDGPPLPPRR